MGYNSQDKFPCQDNKVYIAVSYLVQTDSVSKICNIPLFFLKYTLKLNSNISMAEKYCHPAAVLKPVSLM